MLNSLVKLFKDEEGQGLVEYALILVLISIVVIAVMTTLGGKVKETFVNVTDGLEAPAS
jgi:pilus assembly protein Flp/PilA